MWGAGERTRVWGWRVVVPPVGLGPWAGCRAPSAPRGSGAARLGPGEGAGAGGAGFPSRPGDTKGVRALALGPVARVAAAAGGLLPQVPSGSGGGCVRNTGKVRLVASVMRAVQGSCRSQRYKAMEAAAEDVPEKASRCREPYLRVTNRFPCSCIKGLLAEGGW